MHSEQILKQSEADLDATSEAILKHFRADSDAVSKTFLVQIQRHIPMHFQMKI